MDSEGLILMTNDGKLTHRLTHPKFEHEKEYRVCVSRSPSSEQLENWRRGVTLKNGDRTLPAKVLVESKQAGKTWLRVTLREGQNRQIRRMGEATGLPVERIIRVRIADLDLGDLEPGTWRHLTDQEIKNLKST
jgi:23S rRNA pseudouridine2605 synthase